MGISACIQRFVDNLDIHSKYYVMLLIFQGLLIIATFYVKQKVYDFDYTLKAPIFAESDSGNQADNLAGPVLKLFH
jgi:hypothetical protein